MNELNINMLSESELKELLDIRTQITALQKRYDEIMSVSQSKAPAIIPAPAATPSAVAIQPQTCRPAQVSADPLPANPVPTPVTARPSAPAAKTASPTYTPSRPQATSPATVAAKAFTPTTSPRPVTPAVAQKTEEPEKIKVDSSITLNLRQALVQILTTAAKPLPFNSIFSKLQEAGVQLPESKPMLVVRKLLYEKELFDVVKGGLFQIRAEAEPVDVADAARPQATLQSGPAQVQQTPGPQPQPPQAAPVYIATPQQQPKPASSFNSRLSAILNP